MHGYNLHSTILDLAGQRKNGLRLSEREIARRTGASRTMVHRILARAGRSRPPGDIPPPTRWLHCPEHGWVLVLAFEGASADPWAGRCLRCCLAAWGRVARLASAGGPGGLGIALSGGPRRRYHRLYLAKRAAASKPAAPGDGRPEPEIPPEPEIMRELRFAVYTMFFVPGYVYLPTRKSLAQFDRAVCGR